MRPDFIDDHVKAHKRLIQDGIDRQRRSKRDDRPPYIFHGLRRWELEAKGGRRKYRAMFIPGLKGIYKPIYGASPGTYYCRADGAAATYADAIGPGTVQDDCMDIDTHNSAGDVYLAGDVIKICDDGGVYRFITAPASYFYPQSDGSEGLPITYEPEEGDTPLLYGSVQVSSWTLVGGESAKWEATLTQAPKQCFFSKAGSTKWGIPEVSVAALSAEFEWFHSGSTLYCWSETDPDEAYDWIEATQSHHGFRNTGRDYITVDGLTIKFIERYAIKFHVGADYGIAKNCNISYISLKNDSLGDGVSWDASYGTISGHTIHNTGNHGIYPVAADGQTVTDITIEYNTVSDSFHSLIDPMNINGTVNDITVQYNHCFLTDDWSNDYTCAGIKPQGEPSYKIEDVYVRYNLIENCGSGYTLHDADNVYFYNNVYAGSFPAYFSFAAGMAVNNAGTSAYVYVKNNISIDAKNYEFTFDESQTNLDVDHNLWWKPSGVVVNVEGDGSYTAAQFVSYQSTYDPQDANSLCQDPLFLDASNDNYRLQSGSPCVGEGISVGLEGNNDFYGRLIRPGDPIDIGCSQMLRGGPRRL